MKRLAVIFLSLTVFLLSLLLGVWFWLRGSLPPLGGELASASITAELRLERDAAGRLSVFASSQQEAAFGLGFAHAQDRFLQMDLLRRSAAGELSELIGSGTLEWDKSRRLHRMRHRAAQVFAAMPHAHQQLLQAYAAGVAEGLASIGQRPFSYVLLRSHPQEWTAVDSILAGYAMFFDLQDASGYAEEVRAAAATAFSDEVFQFLYRNGFALSVPIDGKPRPVLPPPAAELWPGTTKKQSSSLPDFTDASYPGSNAWAVSGQLTDGHPALLAVDMHLGMSTPNVWYRAHIAVDDGVQHSAVTGVSLPGVPGILVGSNGHIAWGFTNSYIDTLDLVEMIDDPLNLGHYLTDSGSEPYADFIEWIAIRGSEPFALEVRESRFGPLRRSIDDKRSYAIQWAAHPVGFFNLMITELAHAHSVDAAIAIAQRSGIPTQNFVVADASGNIGWTLCGGIPQRRLHDGVFPQRSNAASAGWHGRSPPSQYPVVINPESQRIWTANNPIIASGPAAALLGDGGYSDDGRASVIREALFANNSFAEYDFLQIQLSTRSHMLMRWQQLFASALGDSPWLLAAPHREAVFDAMIRWDGHAEIDCTHFPIVRDLQRKVARKLSRIAYAPLSRGTYRRHYLADVRRDEVLYQLLTHDRGLLPALSNFSAAELIRECADEVIEEWLDNGQIPGVHRYADDPPPRFFHPISRAVPVLSRWLDMPAVPLPGDRSTPRAQTRSLTASQRMAVRPGMESNGILHMPTGQSDHFLSPFYRSEHNDWVSGVATPLLHGPAQHVLRIRPAATPTADESGT